MDEVSVMSALLTLATSFLTWLITAIGSIITLLTGNEYLLIGTVILLISVAVGFAIRIISTLGHAAR